MYKAIVPALLLAGLCASSPAAATAWSESVSTTKTGHLYARASSHHSMVARGSYYRSLVKRSPCESNEQTEENDENDENNESNENTENEESGDNEEKKKNKRKSSSSKKPTGSTSSGGDGEVFSGGRVTWHNFSGEKNACGGSYEDSDMVVALASEQFYLGADENDSSDKPNCGRTVKAMRGSKSVKVKVVDSCSSCGDSALDLSPAAFKKIEQDLGEGELFDVTWTFAD